MPDATDSRPSLTVVTPTFNNEAVLRQSVDGWRRFGGSAIEVIVTDDGCRDGGFSEAR
jgi:glycosyltransferase involved in cell wall biosynthesis